MRLCGVRMDTLKLYKHRDTSIKKTIGIMKSEDKEKMDLEAGRSQALQRQLEVVFVIRSVKKT